MELFDYVEQTEVKVIDPTDALHNNLGDALHVVHVA